MKINQSKILAILIAVSTAAILYIFLFTGYIFVITSPSHGSFINPVSVTTSHASVNGNRINFLENKWSLDKWRTYPLPFFGGLTKVSLTYEEEGGSGKNQYISINFDLQKPIEIKKDVPLSEADFIERIFVKDNGIALMGLDRTQDSCTIENDNINGYVQISKLDQPWKRFIIEGEITIEPSTFAENYRCHDEKEAQEGYATVEIRNLRFSIDSPVIYEWSNKAGKTWRL